VTVGAKANASSKKGKTAAAALSGNDAPRRFVAPVLADLVSVSSGGNDNSNSDGDRR